MTDLNTFNPVQDVFTSDDQARDIPRSSMWEWDPAEARIMGMSQGERVQTDVYKRAQRDFDSGMVAERDAWHGLSTVVAEAPTAADALKLAGLDWRVSLAPLAALAAGGTVDVGTRYNAVVRDDTNAVLGVVGDRYTPFQNVEGFDLLDDLVMSGELRYEAAGSLMGGSLIYLLARTPEGITIGGDPDETIDPFLLLSNTHDGSRAGTVATTPIRVACRNTERVALKGAKHRWSFRHTKNVSQKADEARRTLGLALDYFQKFEEVANRLLAQPMTAAEFERRFVPLVIPTPILKDGEKDGRAMTNALQARELLRSVHRQSDNIANVRGTRWGAFQAVTEYADFFLPTRKSNRFSAAERMFERNVVDVEPIKDRAMEVLLAL